MSKDLNRCDFIGRVGQDPDMRFTAAGKAIANLSIACSDDYKDKQSGQKVEQTNWIKIVAFDRLAEIIQQYVKKGDQIYVSGKQVTQKYQAQDGTDRYSTSIVANEMQMLGGRAEAASVGHNPSAQPASRPAPQQINAQAAPQTNMDNYDDFIPFS